MCHKGLDYGGSNSVNVDPRGAQLASEPFRHRDYSRLGRPIQRVPEGAPSLHRRDRGDIDDLSVLFFEHEWQDGFGAVKHTGQVYFGDFLPILDGRVHYCVRFQDSRVVDQDVDSPMIIDNLPNNPIDSLGVTDVHLNREDLSAFLFQVFLYLLSRLQAQIGNLNYTPLPSQSTCNTCADTAPGTRNQSNPIGQEQVHMILFRRLPLS